jgi:uncharacterized protein (TIGR03067 family)
MNLQALAAVAAFSLLAAPVPRDATAKDKRALQGTWVHDSLVADGEDVPVRLLPNRTLAIEGDKLTEKDVEKVVSRCAFKLDPSKNPKAIDMTPIGREGPDRAAACLGIYALEGETVKFCFGKPGDERPDDFTSKPGSGRTLLILKRNKP